MIREANVQDIKILVKLAKGFVAESSYPFKANERKIDNLVYEFIMLPDKCVFVMTDDLWDSPVGFIAGQAVPSYFSDDFIAQEVAWYVHPAYRTSREPLKLVKAYEDWAKGMRCTVIQLSTIDHLGEGKVANFYERRGYKKVETAFIKELRNAI